MGINLIDEITPKNDADFPMVQDTYLKGGMRVVSTTTERDNITTERKTTGMLVHVTADGNDYRWNGSSWDTVSYGVSDHDNLTNVTTSQHHVKTTTAAEITDFDTEVSNNSSVVANTAKISYTDAAAVALNTTHRSSDGTDHSDVVSNNAKVSNVSTNLSAGTQTATTVAVNSSDGTNATLVEADTTNAGILGSDKWDEIVANTSSRHDAVTVTDSSTINLTLTAQDITAVTIDGAINHNSLLNTHNLTTDISHDTINSGTIASHDTTATGSELDTLTGGGDTTLHDHDGISENTTHRSSNGTDHSDVVLNNTHRVDNSQAHSDYLKNNATDIGVGLTLTGDNSSADTAYVPMVLYGTDATPPTASGFPIGTIYIQYTP